MNRSELKRIAYKQQLAHLALAQTQALNILIDQQKPFKLNVEGALSYLNLVKTRLGLQQFDEFMQIMREIRDPNSDCMAIISKICLLFRNYPELLQGFGMFLPPSINLQVQTAGRFLTKIENDENFPTVVKSEKGENNNSFDCTSKTGTFMVESDSTVNEIQDNDDSEKASSTVSREIDANYAVNFISKVKERFQHRPEIFDKFLQLLDSVRNDSLSEQVDIETDVFMEVCDLFQNNDDLIEAFKPFVPHATIPEPYEQADDPNDELESHFQNEDSIPFSDSSDELTKYSVVNDPSIAAVGKYGSYEEHLFFDKVRKALHYKEVYDSFLRCLMLFNEDVVTRSELLKIATSFLGKFPDLLKQFKDILGFNESGNNIEAIPMKIIKYENSRLDPEIALDIDYATGGRNGASYRALPKDLKQPKCSGRTPLCKEVLNDTWVSFPSWSEDSTFVTSCKTEFEEMIYRCEDERFELDMAIRANSYTIQALENVQKKIIKMTPEEKSVFSLDDTLGGTSTVLHQKALHRCYGDKTDELVEGLKRNPVVAVPIILKRLRGKEEEWKEKQRHFNTIWREQIDNYYIKSLDHQGINFKQNDSKSFRSKSLLNEMEMVYAEKKEDSVSHSSSPHFLLEFKETCVFLDASNLICQYLKKLPGILREDRRRIELIIRHFIPDFFCFPRAVILEEEAADEDDDEEEEVEEVEEEEQHQEVMDIDNDNEERSGHTSPTESAILSKDEEFSDPEESNSVEENEVSEESDKNSFIEDSDIFDKLDTVLPTNLPYALFFVSKNWYVFFRQFHILCERLSRLLHESNRKDVSPSVNESRANEDDTADCRPSYTELISKLSQLLSGAIDYSQFEDEARSLFGIHAFVSFTMDKLVLNIVRQLQQIVGDDICKQCTSFFFQHNKVIANGSYSSPLESSQVEHEYLKKVERVMNEEKCFKVLWHKKNHTLTIELIEHQIEIIEDPYEVEKWSNYLDAYVRGDSLSEDLSANVPGLPAFLPRNLRRQKEYWKRKVIYVDNLWRKRHSPTYLKKNLPLLCKRKAFFQSSSLPSKMCNFSRNHLNETMSVCSEISTTADGVSEPCQFEQLAAVVSENDKNLNSLGLDKSETTDKIFQKSNENDENPSDMEIEENVPESNASENSNQSMDARYQEDETVRSFSESKDAFCCAGEEASNDENVAVYNLFEDFENALEKGENNTLDSNDGSTCLKDDEQHMVSVAAFHDITEEEIDAENEILDEEKADEKPIKSFELITLDSGDDATVASDTDLIDKKEKVIKAVEEETRPKRERPTRKAETTSRYRKSRTAFEYVRKRNKRNATKLSKEKRSKNKQKEEELDFVTFDYAFFSERSEEDKCLFLAMKDLAVDDKTEVGFKRDTFKLIFVLNCDSFMYRLNCFTKAKEIHQQVSEIKTSNFNAWHRVWLDRYVTPAMSKFCNDWLLRSDPEKFKLVCITMSDCTKPPYIPYSKYRVRYYKTDS